MKTLRTFQHVGRIATLSAASSLGCLVALSLSASVSSAVNFNIQFTSEIDPTPESTSRHCGDLWAVGDYAFIGSDRVGGGIAIIDISNPASPQFVTEYEGNEMEDVEVYNGIGYFGSDLNTVTTQTGPRTGVDIVDVSNPLNPQRITRIAPTSTYAGAPVFPQAHGKVHTLSVSNGFLYTTDNATDTIKVFDVSNPAAPVFKWTIDLGLSSSYASHEVMVKNGRMYVASKNNNDAVNGYTHIYNVANIGQAAPTAPLAVINTGGGTHTAMPSDDGDMIVVSQEREGGVVRIYDVSSVDDDPVTPNSIPAPITLNPANYGLDTYSAHHSHLHGDLLLMSWYEAGVVVFNVADRSNPLFVGSFDTWSESSSVSPYYDGNWGVFPDLGLNKLLLSDRTRGLIMVDASAVESSADHNADGTVDGADLLAWQRNVGLFTASGVPLSKGDSNRNRTVDGLDLTLWKSRFGESQHPHGHAEAVPEGSTIELLSSAALALWGWRRVR